MCWQHSAAIQTSLDGIGLAACVSSKRIFAYWIVVFSLLHAEMPGCKRAVRCNASLAALLGLARALGEYRRQNEQQGDKARVCPRAHQEVLPAQDGYAQEADRERPSDYG